MGGSCNIVGAFAEAAEATTSTWTKLGTDSSDTGKAELQVEFTMYDVVKIFGYVCSSGTTEQSVDVTLNETSGGSLYSMRGDYAANETSYQAQANWSPTFGNSIPARPVTFDITIWKQDANIVGNSQIVGEMVGGVNIDVAASPNICNTWSNSALLFDSTADIVSCEVAHGADNIIGHLQLLGLTYG